MGEEKAWKERVVHANEDKLNKKYIEMERKEKQKLSYQKNVEKLKQMEEEKYQRLRDKIDNTEAKLESKQRYEHMRRITKEELRKLKE